LSEQFQQALTYAAQTIDTAAKNSEDTKTANKTFSVTVIVIWCWHSLLLVIIILMILVWW
jgi:uncharacterized protein YqhQ